MLKQFKTVLAFAALLVFFTACGEHNQPAPNKGKNLESTRIYGESRTAEPIQLANKYDDPEGINDRSKAVYAKMYSPREVNSTNQGYPIEVTGKAAEVKMEETTTPQMKVEDTTTTDTTTQK